MTQVAGIQAVNAEGKVIGTLTVDDLTELVATKIVQEAKNEAVSARSASVMSEASTLAATDEYEDKLDIDTNPAYIRSMDSEGNPKRTATTSLATVVGGLLPVVNGTIKGLSQYQKYFYLYGAKTYKIIYPNASDVFKPVLYKFIVLQNGTGCYINAILDGYKTGIKMAKLLVGYNNFLTLYYKLSSDGVYEYLFTTGSNGDALLVIDTSSDNIEIKETSESPEVGWTKINIQ